MLSCLFLKNKIISPKAIALLNGTICSLLFGSGSRAKLCRTASAVLPEPPFAYFKRFQTKALLQDHRVMVYRIGQLIDNVNLDHIAGLHIKAGLGYANLVKIGSGRVKFKLTAFP